GNGEICVKATVTAATTRTTAGRFPLRRAAMKRLVLLSGLLALSASAADEPSPEPPPREPVAARLVAQKTTYKLDLRGMTAAKLRELAKEGNLPAPPAVELSLEIKNNTKKAVRVRTHGTVPKLTFTLSGKGAVAAPFKTQTAAKVAVTYVVLK